MRYEVTFEGQLSNSAGLISEEIEAFVNSAARELERLGAQEIDLSTNLRTGMVRVAISVGDEDLDAAPSKDADEITKAQEIGSGLIRSAIHAAGGATPGWSVAWLKISTILDELVDTELAISLRASRWPAADDARMWTRSHADAQADRGASLVQNRTDHGLHHNNHHATFVTGPHVLEHAHYV